MRKIIHWSLYIPLALLSLATLSSCCVDCDQLLYETHWIYINDTEYDIMYNNPKDVRFNIKSHDTIIIIEERESPAENLCDDSTPPSCCTDFAPCVVQYGLNKCDTFNVQLGHQWIRDINRFQCKKIGKRKFQYTYRYTEVDYQNANVCE